MRKLAAALLVCLAFALPASAQTSVEQRCTGLGSSSCLCSEPLDANYDGFTTGADFPASPDATECTGNRSGLVSLESSNDALRNSVPVSWTPGGFAMEQAQGSGWMWLHGPQVQNGVNALNSSDRVLCYRYYKQVDSNYGGAGDSCSPGGPTWRNKEIQTDFNQQMQLEENNSGVCPAAGTFNQIGISVDEGPADGVWSLSPPIDYNSCKSAPCRFELCIDGNLQAATNIQYRARIVPLATGVVHSAVTTVRSPGGSQSSWHPYIWGGDLMHSSPNGGARFAFFMAAKFTSDQDQWIGAASEVESGGTGPTPPTIAVAVSTSSGTAPLTGVTGTATASSFGTGPDYRWLFDCNNDGTIEQTVNVNDDATPTSETSTSTACNATYATVGSYTFKATLQDFANNGAGVGSPVATATDTDSVVVSSGVPPPVTVLKAPFILTVSSGGGGGGGTVVFEDDFEGTTGAILASWGNGNAVAVSADVHGASPGVQSLNLNTNIGSTAYVYKKLAANYNELYFRYYAKYTGTAYHHAGGFLGGYYPPTAWPQGDAGVKGVRANGDRMVALQFEAYDSSDSGLTERLDWYANYVGMQGPAVGGLYYGRHFYQDISSPVNSGSWKCIEHRVKMNTTASNSNGELQTWFNGVEVANFVPGTPTGSYDSAGNWQASGGTPFPGFQWRDTLSLGLNWIKLQNYDSTPDLLIDDLKVSTGRIGCI